MSIEYALHNPQAVPSPALLFYPERIRKNIARAIEIAGNAARLRPHAKTHKTCEIARLLLEAGITKQKCATIAEAEALARVAVPHVLIAYPIVGPNIARLGDLMHAFPATTFACLIDHPYAVQQLSDGMASGGNRLEVFLDLNVGQNRTGIAVGTAARDLYLDASRRPGLKPVGFHVYDGQNHQPDRRERESAVRSLLAPVLELRKELEDAGASVPTLVCGGTPTFPVFAARTDIPGIECSPGTFVLDDGNTRNNFPDLDGFRPAAILLTRVVSKPLPNRLTLDLGYKAVASDPPLPHRVRLLNVLDAVIVGQNEEHLIIETPSANRFLPGDPIYALPAHICPTCALHRSAYTVEDGVITGQWDILARDRVLSF